MIYTFAIVLTPTTFDVPDASSVSVQDFVCSRFGANMFSGSSSTDVITDVTNDVVMQRVMAFDSESCAARSAATATMERVVSVQQMMGESVIVRSVMAAKQDDEISVMIVWVVFDVEDYHYVKNVYDVYNAAIAKAKQSEVQS